MRFSANLSFLFKDAPFVERFRRARDAGFSGVEFMGDAAKQLIDLSYEHGNMRLLERVVELQHFLEHRAVEVSQVAASLNEALYGPYER